MESDASRRKTTKLIEWASKSTSCGSKLYPIYFPDGNEVWPLANGNDDPDWEGVLSITVFLG